ncbi:excalibur calcium-binding domain-containing protein [Deinococcus ficus]|uniref:excalibur calcium-binding domain-containing protein n=1 Tax=Deinococcus ficus TaxID=317577 RepID=UPI0003B714A0|nr:excalibur calcium-binding domain-containing protein [Deinococcus ficus]
MKGFVLATALLGSAVAQTTPKPASPPLVIRFLDVGQGDAVLITAPTGETILYDGGRSEARMRELVRQYNVTRVDLVAASHMDADHITGLVPAVALFKPNYFLNNGLAATTQIFQKLLNTVTLAKTQGMKATGQTLNLGAVKVRILAPPAGMPVNEQNVNSIGLMVEYGGFKALMTGDSEALQTNAWLKQFGGQAFGPVDVYKSIHHGAANGDTRAWLAAVRPQNVMVSVGPNNYGHPTQSALDLYKAAGATTWRTDLQGTVTVIVQSDGRYQVSTEFGTVGPQRPPLSRSGKRPILNPITPNPPNVTPTSSGDVYYANCDAVRSAGKSPLLRGQLGYRAGLDRDGDGRACE